MISELTKAKVSCVCDLKSGYLHCELDHASSLLTAFAKAIVSYGGGSIPVLGTVKLKMQRGSFMSLLLCHLMESKHCRPILGKTACERMGVVEIKDSDTIKRPDTSPKILSKDQVIAMFPDVFDDGIGVLQGECHIRHDGSVKPVQHAP